MASPTPTNQPTPSPGRQAGTTQLEFAQAMADFKVMFPSMDSDVIEAVLRANGGAVDATIDNLLVMSADAEAEKEAHPTDDVGDLMDSFKKGAKVGSSGGGGGGGGRLDNPPSYQQATQKAEEADLINLSGSQDTLFLTNTTDGAAAKPVLDGAKSVSGGGGAEFDLLSDLDVLGAAGGLPKHSYTHPARLEAEREEHEEREQLQQVSAQSMIPTQQQLQEIYEENLRQRESSKFATDSAARAQFLEDERIALMLQNEEFMSELRRDQEFMSALEMEEQDKAHDRDDMAGVMMYQRGGKMDEALFREKLKNMGQKSKRKFAQLAGMFSRRKGAKQLLNQTPDDNLLLNAEPLVQDDSDDERQETKSGKTPTKGKYTSFN